MKIPTSKRPKLPEIVDRDGVTPISKWAELCDYGDRLRAWYDQMIVFNPEKDTCTLLFNQSYEINLDRITDTRDLMEWALHLLDKTWIEKDDVATVIRRIAGFKNIEIYR